MQTSHCFLGVIALATRTLQHTATYCSTLQHTATHCNTLQHTAVHCNTLQHFATHCNTLQHSESLLSKRDCSCLGMSYITIFV